jgi:hypothetical protein
MTRGEVKQEEFAKDTKDIINNLGISCEATRGPEEAL